MGKKQEPANSQRFHHGARHCVNVQSEVRKFLAVAMYLVLNRVNHPSTMLNEVQQKEQPKYDCVVLPRNFLVAEFFLKSQDWNPVIHNGGIILSYPV